MNIVSRRPRGRGRAVVAFALSSLLPAAIASAAPTPVSVKAAGPLRSGSSTTAAGTALQPGTSYAPAGLAEAKVTTDSGASFRAMPGSKFSLIAAEPGRLAVRLEEGVLSDADAGSGRIEVVTPAVLVVGDKALVYARVLPRGTYVEHQQGSKGTVELRARGMQPAVLAPGTFRMLADDAGDAVAAVETSTGAGATRVAARAAPPETPAPVGAPMGGSPPPGTRTADGGVVVYTAVVPGAPGPTPYPGPQQGRGPAPSCAPPPCAPCAAPPEVSCAPPCPPAPSTPAQTPCPGCDQPIHSTDVPVPSRPDDAGRPMLGHALGQPGCCGSCCTETMCNKIPYVHYVEGLVCDVTTYKVGCSLITVRPASRVRARRLPDGSLELWAPNIGKDLALIEINENQFGYIGEDGFLVLGPCGTIDYFRGLVHLYTRRNNLTEEGPPKKRREVSGQVVEDEPPTKASR